MLVQNYGWPTGPAKIWLWLARRPFGWPRATGPAGSTTPANVFAKNRKLHKFATTNRNFLKFDSNRVSRSVKTVHTNLFANLCNLQL